eukprot:13655886-Ditylum_brightwellii.AAC.1
MEHEVIRLICKWVGRHRKSILASKCNFILESLLHNRTPWPAFYLLIKVHKTPWKIRPIVSCAGSLLHPLRTSQKRCLPTLQTVRSSKKSLSL